MNPNTESPVVQAPFKAGDVIETDSDALALKLAAQVAGCLLAAIKNNDRATLVVSGGSTPLPFFKALAQQDIAWQKITVTLADERWVDADHADSNEKLVRESLLTGAAGKATFVSLKNPAPDPQDGWQQAEAAIAALPRPLDVVVLGMGGDGHTASLFPDTQGLTEALTIGCGKSTWPMNPPGASQARMSLTLDTLIDTSACFLHITGEQKRTVLKEAASASSSYPIAAVLQAAADRLKIYWAP